RVVSYQWALNPLSSKGSLIDPGGRFNIGEIDSIKFPIFPALYLAENKETALQEKFSHNLAPNSKLSYLDLALTKEESITVVCVSGRIKSVIDLTNSKALAEFCSVIRKTKYSQRLQNLA